MAEIKFTEQAIKDLEEIASYISTDSLYYAKLQLQKILLRIDILQNFPYLGRIVPELKTKSVRELIEGYYRIIYKIINKKEIHILTIHHSRKRLFRGQLKRLSKS